MPTNFLAMGNRYREGQAAAAAAEGAVRLGTAVVFVAAMVGGVVIIGKDSAKEVCHSASVVLPAEDGRSTVIVNPVVRHGGHTVVRVVMGPDGYLDFSSLDTDATPQWYDVDGQPIRAADAVCTPPESYADIVPGVNADIEATAGSVDEALEIAEAVRQRLAAPVATTPGPVHS